jgi:phenylacetate-CoA ligase
MAPQVQQALTPDVIELPCGHYHVCEDSVHLDVLDLETLQPQLPGRSGLAVVTNLLNEAMPFICYVQGDYVTRPENPEPCEINWSQIASIDGRLNDAFINRAGRKVPAGSILDATYRWMFDCELHLAAPPSCCPRTTCWKSNGCATSWSS